MIEAVESTRIDLDRNGVAATLSCLDEVVTWFWRGPVVLGANQDQEWDASSPARALEQHPTPGVEGDSTREVRPFVQSAARADHVENGRGSVGPAK
jgi:hypothetical protein